MGQRKFSRSYHRRDRELLAQSGAPLAQLGFEPHLVQRQRPRVFDPGAWEALERAETLVGLPKVQLLRAALVLLARDGPTRVSLRAAIEELEGGSVP